MQLEKTNGAIKNPEKLTTLIIGHTRNKTKTNKTQKTKKNSNMDPTKKRGRTHVLTKGKQFLSLI